MNPYNRVKYRYILGITVYPFTDLRFGCRLEWCTYIPKIEMAQFFVGAYITLIGYPFVVALTSGIYSRVLGNIPQVFTFYIFCINK